MKMYYRFFAWILIGCAALIGCSSSDTPVEATGIEGNTPISGSGASGVGGATAATTGRAGTTAAGRVSILGGSGGAVTAGKASTAGSDTPVAGSSGASGAAGAAGKVDAGAKAGSSGSPGAAGSAASVKGCDDTKLLPELGDISKRGPWPVGEITVKFGPFAAVDVMYPAKPGSEAGKSPINFDGRMTLPPAEADKVPDEQATMFELGTYAELPIDDAHGPYPAVILVHGTASFRLASASTQANWASHGFIVMAADHPDLCLYDMIANCTTLIPLAPTTLSRDVDAEIAALNSPTGQLAFLAGHVDMNRIALAGHSAGAYNVGQWSSKPNVQVIIELDGTMVVAKSSSLKSTLFVGGMADTVLPYEPGWGAGSILYGGSQVQAYEGSPVIKRIVGVAGGGHLTPTNLCQPNDQGQVALNVSIEYQVSCVSDLESLNDCGTTDWKKGVDITSDITTGVLEETLHCQDRAAVISAIKSRHPEVGDFRETLK
jgi:hypothetical protein